jgi:DNA-directed RNA polymerase subunit F
MIGKQQEGSKLASIYDVKEILEEKKEHTELGYEQKLAYEYAHKFAKLDKGDVNKLKKELEGFGLKEKTIMKILEIMPVDANQLKLILVPEKKVFEEEEVKKMLAVIESYRGK